MLDWTVIITTIIVNEARQYLFTPPTYCYKALLGTTRCNDEMWSLWPQDASSLVQG